MYYVSTFLAFLDPLRPPCQQMLGHDRPSCPRLLRNTQTPPYYNFNAEF